MLAEGGRNRFCGIGRIGSVGIDQATKEKPCQQADFESLEILVLVCLADLYDDVADPFYGLRILQELLAPFPYASSAFRQTSSKWDSESALSMRRERLSLPLGVMQSIRPVWWDATHRARISPTTASRGPCAFNRCQIVCAPAVEWSTVPRPAACSSVSCVTAIFCRYA